MLRQAGRFTLALLLAAFAAACTNAGDGGTARRDDELPDGWTIPEGAELVGAVVPSLSAERSYDGQHQRAWFAVLRVADGPEPVYRALNAQVTAEGMPAMGLTPNACQAVPVGRVTAPEVPTWAGEGGTTFRCAGSSTAHGRTLSVCVGQSYGIVQFRRDVDRPPRSKAERLHTSEQLGAGNPAWPDLAGTRRLVPPNPVASCGIPDLLEVTGRPDRVWNEFRDDARNAEAAQQFSARRYGSDVTELVWGGFDYDATVTRVVPPHGPTVIAIIASS